MAILAADTAVSTFGVPLKINVLASVAGDVFYSGALVYVDVGGAGVAGSATVVPAVGDRFLGISPKQQTPAAAGDLVEVYIEGVFEIPNSTLAATDNGDMLVFDSSGTKTDNPADLVAMLQITPVVSDAVVGQIIKADGTRALIAISPGFSGRLVATVITNAQT